MAVYFFFQYVLGAGFGTVVTGIVSDFYAKQAMLAAGAGGGRTGRTQQAWRQILPFSHLVNLHRMPGEGINDLRPHRDQQCMDPRPGSP